MRSESGFGTVKADVVVKAQTIVPRVPVLAPPAERFSQLPHRGKVGAPQFHDELVKRVVCKADAGGLV